MAHVGNPQELEAAIEAAGFGPVIYGDTDGTFSVVGVTQGNRVAVGHNAAAALEALADDLGVVLEPLPPPATVSTLSDADWAAFIDGTFEVTPPPPPNPRHVEQFHWFTDTHAPANDTWESIAAYFGIDKRELWRANGSFNPAGEPVYTRLGHHRLINLPPIE